MSLLYLQNNFSHYEYNPPLHGCMHECLMYDQLRYEGYLRYIIYYQIGLLYDCYHFLKSKVIVYEEEAFPHILLTDSTVLLNYEIPLRSIVQIWQNVGTE